jgi:TPR repeat
MPFIVNKHTAESLEIRRSAVSAFLCCVVRLCQQEVIYPRFIGKRRMRRADISLHQVRDIRIGSVFILMAVLHMFCLTAFAQQSNLDYYAPRTGQNEIQLFNNVQGYHLGPGREEMEKGRYGAALEHFEFILRYYPNHPQTLISLSELCLRWKSTICDATAEKWYQRAIERNPGAAQSYVVQALHLHRKNRLDDAVRSYKRAIELAPNSLNAHYNIGLAYADLKQYELANLHAQKSYTLGANLPGLRSRLEKVGKWNPNVSLPDSEAKPATEPSPPNPPEKVPE